MYVPILLFGLGMVVLFVSVFLKTWVLPLAGMFLFIAAMMQDGGADTWFQWACIVLAVACFMWSVIAFWKAVQA